MQNEMPNIEQNNQQEVNIEVTGETAKEDEPHTMTDDSNDIMHAHQIDEIGRSAAV